MTLFKNHLVLSTRIDGLTQLVVRNLATGASHQIAFGEKVYDVQLARNPEFDTTAGPVSLHLARDAGFRVRL